MNKKNISILKLKKIKLLDKFSKKKFQKKIIYFLFINLTLNNLFSYVYNFYNFRKLAKKIIRYKLNFMCSSLGITKYKGPAKFSNIALESSGILLAKKLKKKKINKVNLVLFTRLNRKIKEFLKGFVKIGRIKIKRIFFFSKFAHNGCRLKSRKRR